MPMGESGESKDNHSSLTELHAIAKEQWEGNNKLVKESFSEEVMFELSWKMKL